MARALSLIYAVGSLLLILSGDRLEGIGLMIIASIWCLIDEIRGWWRRI